MCDIAASGRAVEVEVVVQRRKRAGCPREKEGEELLRHDDQVCAADEARIHLAGTRSGQRPAPGRRNPMEVPFSFSLRFFWGVCVCEASSVRVELV